MAFDFSGHRVLVSGAAHGIGAAVCDGFRAAGATVLATDVLAGKSQDSGLASLDVTDEAEIAKLVAAEDDFDIYVHVAGGVLGQRIRVVRRWIEQRLAIRPNSLVHSGGARASSAPVWLLTFGYDQWSCHKSRVHQRNSLKRSRYPVLQTCWPSCWCRLHRPQ